MRTRCVYVGLLLLVAASVAVDGQTRKRPARKTSPPPALTSVYAEVQCPSELGIGIRTNRRFCDVLSGRDPTTGVLIAIPPHIGPVTLSFELHNRHTYSEELIRTKRAFRDYTASIGVFTMDNTLIQRAVIQSQFRTSTDLFDRIHGGAGPGGMKAIAPTGTEFIAIELPEDVGEQVSLVGEKLKIIRADGAVDQFLASGRPIATISNVRLEYRPAPPPRKSARKP